MKSVRAPTFNYIKFGKGTKGKITVSVSLVYTVYTSSREKLSYFFIIYYDKTYFKREANYPGEWILWRRYFEKV